MTLQEQIGRFRGALTDLLFPSRCAVCQRYGVFLCRSCVEGFLPLPASHCRICSNPNITPEAMDTCANCINHLPHYRRAESAFLFDGDLRHAVHTLKYENQHRVAQPLALAAASALTPTFLAHTTGLIAVPLHDQRLRQRGYNQAWLIAAELSQQWQLPLLPSEALKRIRSTPSQTTLTFEERRENVHQAFTASSEWVKGQSLIIIDDVSTTGATIDGCAAALLDAGAHEVFGYTLARAR